MTPPTPIPQEPVAVTQADRDRAASYVSNEGLRYRTATDIELGRHDKGRLVQAFAHHRTQAVAEAGWQPIESAPRDGTKFDAWVPDVFGGHRMTGLSFNWKGQLRQHGLLTPAELPRWPTHWRSLPEPPTPAGDAA